MTKKNNYQVEWRFEKDLIEYPQAIELMTQRVEKIINHQASDLIWVLEHPSIYTAGVSAKDSDVLNADGVKIYQTNRGGKYTYHAPGMKIVYVMIDLKKFFYPNKPDVASFVKFLENWIIDLLSEYQIIGKIRENRVGIWVEKNPGNQNSDQKISAIGIKLKKWVSYHGIAINVDCDLSGFNRIIPCGISKYGITSMEHLGCKTKDQFFNNEFEKNLEKKFYQNLKFI
jgi:lipoyl(octanoyl) transferase